MTQINPIQESAAVASQPAAVTPDPAPSSGVVVAADLASTPIAEVTPAIEGAPVVPAAPAEEQPNPGETLLQKFDREKKEAEPAKPADVPAVEAPKPGEQAAPAEVAAPALEPVAYEYALPETLKMDEATKGEVHTLLDAFRADPAKGAQGLLDLHAKKMGEYADHLVAEQHRVFNETRRGWITEVMADPELGGSGFQTAMGVVARMRDEFVRPADVAAFNQFLEVTGAGDHPQFLKLMHNVGRMFDEPALPAPNAKPTPQNGQPPKRGMSSLYNRSGQ